MTPAEYMRARRAKLRAAGLCMCCAVNPRAAHSSCKCLGCLKDNAAFQRQPRPRLPKGWEPLELWLTVCMRCKTMRAHTPRYEVCLQCALPKKPNARRLRDQERRGEERAA